MKRIIIIIGIILAIAAMGLGIYFAWLKSREVASPPETGGQLPSVTSQKFQQIFTPQPSSTSRIRILSSQPVFDYWISGASATSTSSSSQIFYLTNDGKIIKLSDPERGEINESIITQEPIANLQSIKIGHLGRVVLIKSGDILNPVFTLWNSDTNARRSLPANVLAAALSPDGGQIAYLKTDDKTGLSNLFIEDLFGIKPRTQKVLSLREADLGLSWINPAAILFAQKPSSEYESQIWSLDLKSKTFNLLDFQRGLMVDWSSDGKLGLKWSIASNRVARLSLIQSDGNSLANLNIKTLPDKCLIAAPLSPLVKKEGSASSTSKNQIPVVDREIYCAVVQSYNSNIEPVLPDDYLKRAVYSRDAIYGIDLNQNAVLPVFTASQPVIDAVRLELLGNRLLFINRYDNQLYSLEL